MIERYFPCEVTCIEPFDLDAEMTRASCRHGVFAVTVDRYSAAYMVEAMCRSRLAMKLLDDYATGQLQLDDGMKRTLREKRMIPY